MSRTQIQFSHLLYENVSTKLLSLEDVRFGSKSAPLPSVSECENLTERYRAEWACYERKILGSLEVLLGCKFREDIINVYVTPLVRCMSSPCIINTASEPDEFVDVLTHELIHVILTHNSLYLLSEDGIGQWLYKSWSAAFSESDYEALVHIPVHAIHAYIYCDVLQSPDRMERDRLHSKINPHMKSYELAWRHVEKLGYHQTIETILELMNYKLTGKLSEAKGDL